MTDGAWERADAKAKAVLDRHDGVAKRSAFLSAGLEPLQVAALFRRRVIERPRSGWYVDPVLPWQAKHAIRVGGVLACVSAIDSFGLPVPFESSRSLHVLVPANAPRIRHNRDRRHYVVPGEDREVSLHWSNEPGTIAGWRTDLVTALLAALQCLPEDWWIAAVDAALHRPRHGAPILTSDDSERLRAALPRTALGAWARVDARAESVVETLLRLAMLRRGIPIMDLQFKPNRLHRVDFLLPGRLVVEVDGAQYHDPAADAERDRILRGLGYRVLRIPAKAVLERIEDVLDTIEAALAGRVFVL